MMSIHLPIEIIDHILQYDGRIKYRNGKFMNQLAPRPELEKRLNAIPPKYQYFSGKPECFWNNIVEFYVYVKPLSVTKMILEYNNYFSSYNDNGVDHNTVITYLFYCKPAYREMYCLHITY